MVYNELEQEGILSAIRFGLALLAYTDILLCSIYPMHKIRQTPVIERLAVRESPGQAVGAMDGLRRKVGGAIE